jgi:hypothetical protein
MGYDRDSDWEDHLKQIGKDWRRRDASNLGAIERAALAASQVTGDEYWDLFLSVINERLESRRKSLEDFRNKLEISNDFSTEALINQKLSIRQLGCEIEALEWVTGLPKELMEKGERAKELLEINDETTH